jgi:hypothetical protein
VHVRGLTENDPGIPAIFHKDAVFVYITFCPCALSRLESVLKDLFHHLRITSPIVRVRCRKF